MSQTRLVRSLALAGLVAAFAVGSAFAQGTTGGGGGGGRGGGGRAGGRMGGFDPAQMRQRMEDRIKTDFGSTDDEWKAIQPLVDKVLTLQTEVTVNRFGGRRGGGPAGGTAAPAAALSPVQQAHQDLQTVLDNKDSTAAEIAPKLKAYRDARDKAKTDLVAAQTALKAVLSARQEALLVQMGIID